MSFWSDMAKLDIKFREEKEKVENSSKNKRLKPFSSGIQQKLFETDRNQSNKNWVTLKIYS